MTFAELLPDVAYMRSREADFLGRLGWDDATIRDRYLTAAKQDLLDDLQRALGLNPAVDDDMAKIDALIDTHQGQMTRTLSALVLVYVFENSPTTEGNLVKSEHWISRYREARRGFVGLVLPSGSSAVFNVSLVQ